MPETVQSSQRKTRPLDAAAIRAYREGERDEFGAAPQIFGKLAKAVARSLLGLCAAPPNLVYERHGKAGPVPEDMTLSCLLTSPDRQHMARIAMDRPMIFALCDLLFGGTGMEPAYTESRPCSPIERSLAQHVFSLAGEQFQAVFPRLAQLSFSPFKVDREADEDPPSFEPRLRATLIMTVMGYGGELTIDLCKSLAEDCRPVTNESQAAPASLWSGEMAQRVEASTVELTAILASFPMPLHELASLEPGQRISLDSFLHSPVTLLGDGVTIHKARLGQHDRRFCLSIL